MDEFPKFIHGWAQSDRYALAHGCINNGFNFFKPETLVYNHQFPTNWIRPSNSTITAVDFPIHEYLVAILMTVVHSTAPIIFRMYTLLYSFAGLFFLYKLSYLITRNYYKSIFVILFAATSPVYVYYQNGFLPTLPSLANVIIGTYFYCRYMQSAERKDFLLSILFLTLAALNRSTCVIPLVAVFGLELLRIIRKKSTFKGKILPVFFSIGSILGYIWYNNILRKEYGSLFLNLLMPAESKEEAKQIFAKIYERWIPQYFSGYHYWALLALIICALPYLRRKSELKQYLLPVALLFSAVFAGSAIFLVVMLKQFLAHDYYFLDTFFFPILLFVILLLAIIPSFNFRYFRLVYIALLALIAFPFITNAKEAQVMRREEGSWDIISRVLYNFRNADIFVDSLHIPMDAKIIVFDSGSPNIPFILMKRKGYMNTVADTEIIKGMLDWDADYVIIQNNVLASTYYLRDPAILGRLDKIADNSRISICSIRKTPKEQSVSDFLGLNNLHFVYERAITFDEPAVEEAWKNIVATTEIEAYSGSVTGKVSPENEYAVSYEKKRIPGLKDISRTIILSGHFYQENLSECLLVANLKSRNKLIYYQTYDLSKLLKKKNTWEKLEVVYTLPPTDSDDNEIGIFIWNINKKNTLFVDDFNFKIY